MLAVPHRVAVLLALVLWAPELRCPVPDFDAAAEPLDPTELGFPLPAFRVPLADDGCPILAVFVEQHGEATASLHVVTADEDHPLPLIDQLYDAERWFGLVAPSRRFPFVRLAPSERPGYRRVADVETIELRLSPDRGTKEREATDGGHPDGGRSLEAIHFPGTYSAGQSWNVLLARHHSATIPAARFEREGGRPVLHVNTWNHLFSNEGNNPGAPHRLVTDYPVYRGTRGEVQALFDGVWTDFGLGL